MLEMFAHALILSLVQIEQSLLQQVGLVLVTRPQNWVKSPIMIIFKSRDYYYIVYSFTNLFTYLNDYLMCRSTGANIRGLKVRVTVKL